MSRKEKWVKWEPIDDLPVLLYLEELRDNYQGITLKLQGEEKTSPLLVVNFDGALSYRTTDEGDLLKTLGEVEGYGAWSLFKVENSKYVEWFHEQSLGIRRDQEIVHFVFATANDVVEVLDLEPPTLRWETALSSGATSSVSI